jgi:hypothetical protein
MWANAYLEQARSDWKMRSLMEENSAADCHCLHYLQMATEKLAKAALLRGTTKPEDLRRSHKAFVRFLRSSAKNPSLRRTFGLSARQLQESINGILPIAAEVERLVPGLDQLGPNAEYPWETPSGEVKVPASYAFPVAAELRGPQGRKLLSLISVILDRFDAFF